MTVLKKMFVAPAMAIALVATQADAFVVPESKAQVAPPASYQGQWYTTPDGCSYSRAQAPGYAVMWMLIQNPHHIGQPKAGRHCTSVLKTQG